MSLIPEECPPRPHYVDKAFVDVDRHYTQLRRAPGHQVTATEFFTDQKNEPGVYWYFGEPPTYKHSPIPQLMDSTRGSAASNSTTSSRPPSTPVGSIHDAHGFPNFNDQSGSYTQDADHQMDDLPEGYDYKEFIQVSARLLS
jgi:hypothetical protein